MTATQNKDDGLREQIAYSIGWTRGLTAGESEAMDNVMAAIQQYVAGREAVVRSDLMWCLGSLRGLGYPAEHLEQKYRVKQERTSHE